MFFVSITNAHFNFVSLLNHPSYFISSGNFKKIKNPYPSIFTNNHKSTYIPITHLCHKSYLILTSLKNPLPSSISTTNWVANHNLNLRLPCDNYPNSIYNHQPFLCNTHHPCDKLSKLTFHLIGIFCYVFSNFLRLLFVKKNSLEKEGIDFNPFFYFLIESFDTIMSSRVLVIIWHTRVI